MIQQAIRSGEMPGSAVVVLSRQAAERWPAPDNAGCISITNPRQSPAKLTGYDNILRLGFHDTDQVGGNFTVMSPDDATQVLRFGDQHRALPLTMHCEFGASRSVAVGLFLAAWLSRPLVIAETDVLLPKPWVVNQLRAAALKQAIRTCDRQLLSCALLGPRPHRVATHFRPSLSYTGWGNSAQPTRNIMPEFHNLRRPRERGF